jgi:hypothetical protein
MLTEFLVELSVLQTLRRLWRDDDGAVITTEWLMISAVLLGGLSAALVGLRNRMVRSIDAIGDMVDVQPSAVPPPVVTPMGSQQQTQNQSVVIYNGYVTPNP